MKTKAKKSRSISIRLSMRTFNEISKILIAQEEGSSNKRTRYQAALLRRRLDRAPRLNRAGDR